MPKTTARPRWAKIPHNFFQDTAKRVYEVDTANRLHRMPEPPPIEQPARKRRRRTGNA